MSAARAAARSSAAALADVGWVVAHHALPDSLLTALSTALRVPVLIGSASALLGGAAALAALVHLSVRLAPSVAVPAIVLVLAMGPLVRVAIGATPPLVASVAAAAPLLRALDLGDGRGWGALAATAPVLLGSGVVAGAAALSLSTAGDPSAGAHAVAVGIASAGGLVAAGALAALRVGRPLLSGLVARLAVVLAAGAAGWAAVAAGPLALRGATGAAEALAALGDAIAAAPPSLVLAITAAPALWIAGELLARDARPLVRLLRELVSSGASRAAIAAVVAVGMLAIGLAGAPIAGVLAALAGAADAVWAAVAIAWHVLVAATAVVLLEPGSERIAVRTIAFALLLTPPVLVAIGAIAPAWLPAVGAATTAAGVAASMGWPR